MTRHVLTLLWMMLGGAAACITVPGSAELLLVSVPALFPVKRKPSRTPPGPWRSAVVVPAHNEQVTITTCVQSLLAAHSLPEAPVDIFVVADNCTDDTAQLGRAAGACVLERNNLTDRGKGFALQHAFTYLLPLGYHSILVVDADSIVAPNFLAATVTSLRGGADAVQARYLVRNATETLRSRLMRVALLAFNLVRPLGRSHLGLSCGIFGNGFGLRRETILAVPYLATSLVEDLEYHLALVRSGRRVEFLNHTAVYAEMPVKAHDIKTQRARWEGGRLRTFAASAPSLCRDIATGKMRCVEPLLDLLLLPLAFHMVLLALALATPAPAVRAIGLAGICIVLLHLVAALVTGEGRRSDIAVLAAAPFYVLWKLLLLPTLIRSARPGQHWVRTGRNEEPQLHEPATHHPD